MQSDLNWPVKIVFEVENFLRDLQCLFLSYLAIFVVVTYKR